MRTQSRLRIEMAVRVRNLLRANPFGEPKADAVVAKFEERVTRALDLITQYQSGTVQVRGTRAKRRELRRKLVAEPLRHLARIAKAASVERPDLRDLLRIPAHLSEPEFLAAIRGITARIVPHQELLGEYGLNPSLLDELTGLVASYEAYVNEMDEGRRTHTGARAELDTIASELIRMVNQLEGMILYRTRENAELAGAWKSARNVAWPSPSAPQPAPTDGQNRSAA